MTLLLAMLVFASQDPGDAPFDFRTDSAFGDATARLEELLKGKRGHFCVVGYQGPGESRRAWVVWREGRRIILWEGSSIAHSRRTLRLKKDVVRSEVELKGSTYLVTRAWVDRVTSDCARRGVAYDIDSRK
jgi:hypothetical protein